jgi:uncharacterized protein YjbI with pentapeptide repeats
MGALLRSRGNLRRRLLPGLVGLLFLFAFLTASAGATTLTAGADHSNENHSGENHSNQDLTSITLTNSNLSSSNLKNTIFALALIDNANLSGANLTGVDFTGAILDGSDFSGSNVKDSDFSGASLVGVDFTVGNWAGAVFTGAIYDNTTLFAPGFDLSSLVYTPEPSPGLLVSMGLLGLSIYSRRLSRFRNARTS